MASAMCAKSPERYLGEAGALTDSGDVLAGGPSDEDVHGLDKAPVDGRDVAKARSFGPMVREDTGDGLVEFGEPHGLGVEDGLDGEVESAVATEQRPGPESRCAVDLDHDNGSRLLRSGSAGSVLSYPAGRAPRGRRPAGAVGAAGRALLRGRVIHPYATTGLQPCNRRAGTDSNQAAWDESTRHAPHSREDASAPIMGPGERHNRDRAARPRPPCSRAHRGGRAFELVAGVAPIPATSGQVVNRHRIKRYGDSQLNRALHNIVFSWLRYNARDLYRLLEHPS